MAQGTLIETLERRSKAEQRIVKALEHIRRERAMSIVMSFLPIEDLEEIADFQEGRS